MITVRIFKPAKTAMSSGRGNTQKWILQYEAANSQYIEPVMQWTASNTTQSQVSLKFETKEEAIAFAEKNNWKYDIQEPKQKIIKPKSYTDNFMR